MAFGQWRAALSLVLSLSVFGCATAPVLQSSSVGMMGGDRYKAKSLSTPRSRFSKKQVLVKATGQAVAPGARIKGTLGQFQVHELPPGMSVESAISAYRQMPGILSVEKLEQVGSEPDQPPAAPVAQAPAPSRASNDPLLYQQWSHVAADVPKAWQTTKGREDVIVAVLDSGVDFNHPDLVGRVINGPDFGEGKDGRDIDEHGTHVAGIIAANADNGIGVAGVAPRAKVLNLKMTYPVMEDGKFVDMTYDEFTMAKAIQYAATDGGAKVINISYGIVDSELVANMLDFARGRGLIICVSAGNKGNNVYTGDAKYQDGVLAVHALDPAQRLASFSNFGTTLGITAPGVGILSTVPTYANPYTGEKYGKDGYDTLQGTSMASPFVAGVAALAVSALTDAGNKALEKMGASRRLKPADVPGRLVEDLLRSTCYDLGRPGRDETYGAGMVNAGRAVEAAKSATWLNRLLDESRVDRRR
jgi:subtilisin family serine protease